MNDRYCQSRQAPETIEFRKPACGLRWRLGTPGSRGPHAEQPRLTRRFPEPFEKRCDDAFRMLTGNITQFGRPLDQSARRFLREAAVTGKSAPQRLAQAQPKLSLHLGSGYVIAQRAARVGFRCQIQKKLATTLNPAEDPGGENRGDQIIDAKGRQYFVD